MAIIMLTLYNFGKVAGQTILFICFLVVGPLIAIPRIVTLSHTMIGPFLPINYLQHTETFGSDLFLVYCF